MPIPGSARILLELVHCDGAVAYRITAHSMAAMVFIVLAAVHYGLSADRIIWLLRRRATQ